MRTSLRFDPVLGQRRRRRRLGGIVEQDLALLFNEWALGESKDIGASAPAGTAPAPAADEPEPLGEGQAMLTLGGASVVVPVSAEPSPDKLDPVLEHEEASVRIRQWNDNRRAVAEVFDAVAACEAATVNLRTHPDRATSAARDIDVEAPPIVTRFTPQDPAPGKERDSGAFRPDAWAEARKRLGHHRDSFSWRRMLTSAAVSSGLGAAALLMIHWIAH